MSLSRLTFSCFVVISFKVCFSLSESHWSCIFWASNSQTCVFSASTSASTLFSMASVLFVITSLSTCVRGKRNEGVKDVLFPSFLAKKKSASSELVLKKLNELNTKSTFLSTLWEMENVPKLLGHSYKAFSHDVISTIFVSQNSVMAAMMLSRTSPGNWTFFLIRKNFLLFQ